MGHPACVSAERRQLTSIIDSANAATALESRRYENDINIDIGPFSPLFTIKTNYSAVSGALPKLQKPTLEFGEALKALKEFVDALKHSSALGLDFDVDVDAGNGPSPSFIINITLRFRLGEGPNERIDIGVGKFYGEFRNPRRLEAALSGSTRGGSCWSSRATSSRASSRHWFTRAASSASRWKSAKPARR